jgi:membrane-associated PAP2 superfamily phosphatase
MWLSGALYEWEGSSWRLYKHWFTYDVIHHWGKRLIHLLGFLLLALWSLSPHFHTLRGLRKYRRSMLYLVLCLVLIPSVIARMKHFTHGPCPIDIINFGGSEIYRHNFSYPFEPGGTGHCYPSGHAGAGFSLLALYFAAYFHLSKKRLLFLVPGLLLGSVFAISQRVRGAHFLSHLTMSLFICWFLALLFHFLFELSDKTRTKPNHEPQNNIH